MTWKSSCSIASDDENSLQSFLSDCDSEFDLRPPPRYPADKRSPTTLNKRISGRSEPPLTRSRLKATGKTLPSSPTLPKSPRSSTHRRNFNPFSTFNPTIRDDLQQNMFLFTKQEASINEKVPGSPMDGVKFLTDRFENCSLDEEKINRGGIWPSQETKSHYVRPMTSPSIRPTFDNSPFSIFNQSATLFSSTSSGTSSPFGQHQAQVWTRFHNAASALRNDSCVEQVQMSMTNLFTPNSSFQSFNSPQSSPFTPSMFPATSIRQRKTETPVQPTESIESTVQIQNAKSSSSSKYAFTILIFFIGLMFGYVLTSTFPPNQLWSIVVEYIRLALTYVEAIVQYFQSSR